MPHPAARYRRLYHQRTTIADFNPLTISGMILWVDIHRMGLADSASIVTLVDYSLREDITQGTSANRATNVANSINGRAAASFDGTNDQYISSTWTTNQQFCIQMVFKFPSATGSETIFSHGSGNSNGYRILKDTGNREGVCRAVAAQVDASATTNWECWSWRRTSAPNVTLKVNGVNTSLTNATASMNNPSGGCTVGSFESGTPLFAGLLAEIRVWDNDIGATNEDTSIASLMAKYAL